MERIGLPIKSLTSSANIFSMNYFQIIILKRKFRWWYKGGHKFRPDWSGTSPGRRLWATMADEDEPKLPKIICDNKAAFVPETPIFNGLNSKNELDLTIAPSVPVIGQPQDEVDLEDRESFLGSDLSTEVESMNLCYQRYN